MDDSISCWIAQIKQGDAEAAAKLWDRFFQRLISLARGRMRGAPRRIADEEDVALSVFDSLCRGASRGLYPALEDRDNLWSLLIVMTSRKVCDHVSAERAQKRGGGRVVAVTDLAERSRQEAQLLDAVLSREPTPDMAASFAEECDRLLDQLDPELRALALRTLDGASQEELAEEFSCGLRTVQRRLGLIRRIWSAATPDAP